MDNVSKLLQEAKPLYIKKEREKKAVISGVCSLCLAVGIFFGAGQGTLNAPQFDDALFDSYVTALYSDDDMISDELFYDDISDEGEIVFNRYGLYEV